MYHKRDADSVGLLLHRQAHDSIFAKLGRNREPLVVGLSSLITVHQTTALSNVMHYNLLHITAHPIATRYFLLYLQT